MTARGTDPDIALAWNLVDSIGQRTPDEQWEHGAKKSAELVVAAVIARAAASDSARRTILADSARKVLVRSRPSREEDPEGELIGTEAFARTLLGDKDEVFRLLKQYFALNPGHRPLFAKGNSWWWRPIKDDPRFSELVGHAQ